MPKPGSKELVREIKSAEIASYTRRQLDELIRIYRSAEREIQKKILNVSSENTRARNTQILRQLNLIIFSLEAQAAEWAEDVLPKSYQRGIDVAARQLARLGVADSVDPFARIHTSAISVLADGIVLDTVKAGAELRQLVGSYIQRTQLAKGVDEAITRGIAEGIIQGRGSRKQRDALLEIYRERIGNGQFVSIGGRNYRLDKYLELVARTRTREAVTQGTINTAVQYGLDLVMWDIHDNPCPKCQPYSGRVFSITGANLEFPRLTVKPPVHPMCECTIHPITDERLQESDKYEELVALSNNQRVKILGRGDYEQILGKKPMEIAEADANTLGPVNVN
jgi:hypothetical protein